jgi:hypothetical protein
MSEAKSNTNLSLRGARYSFSSSEGSQRSGVEVTALPISHLAIWETPEKTRGKS